MCYWWSVKEFGRSLHKTSSWFPLGFIRHDSAKKVRGGYAAIFKMLIHCLFAATNNIMHGILVTTQTGTVVITMVLGLFAADEAAIKDTWSWKGASGWKPCFACHNLLIKRNVSGEDRHGSVMPRAEHRRERFETATDEFW